MRKFLASIKDKFRGESDEDYMEDKSNYVELDAASEEIKPKVIVRPFNLESFDDVKPILEAMREGNTICLINIRTLKDSDLVELKRAINKIKKTCDAIEGQVAGFGEDWIVVTPAFASIYRGAEGTADVVGDHSSDEQEE